MLIWHVLGWTTMAAQGALSIGVGYWLRKASREARTWRRPLKTPKFITAPLTLSAGADYVGHI